MTNSARTLPNTTQPQGAQLLPELRQYCENKFTGRVELLLNNGWRCSLYLNLGNLVWASGGVHPIRRWRRLMNLYCPQALSDTPSVREADRFECWDYHILTVLVQRGRITDESILSVVENLVSEILFDFVQALAFEAKSQTRHAGPLYQINDDIGVRPSETSSSLLRKKWTLEVETTLRRVQENWRQWNNAGFAALLPDLAPIVVQSEQLAQRVNANTYRQLKTSINGKNSLRELAVLTKRDTAGVARSLLPFLRQKQIKLVEIPDLRIPENALSKSKKRSPHGLIVCIDDSKRVCEVLEGIVSEAGYECLTVQNPLQALPLLIQRKPSLIFLDITMPTINGYELCSQIRRLPGFQETPVVILTSNDRIIDRVRAKMVGATDFLTKPVEAKKVIGTAKKHLES